MMSISGSGGRSELDTTSCHKQTHAPHNLRPHSITLSAVISNEYLPNLSIPTERVSVYIQRLIVVRLQASVANGLHRRLER